MTNRTHLNTSPREARHRPGRNVGTARAALVALLGGAIVAACTSQPMTREEGRWGWESKGVDCTNKVIGRIHNTLDWKKEYLPGDHYHGVLADEWSLCEQQIVQHDDGLVSLICIWCSSKQPQWKLINEGCSGQLYRFVPRKMAPTPSDEGPPKISCLSFFDLSAAAGTLDADLSAGPAALGQLGAFEAGLLDIDSIDLSDLAASLTFSVPEDVGGFVVAGEAFGIDVAVDGASQLDLAHQVLQLGRGSTVTASGPLLQVAGWAWYAGLVDLEVGVGSDTVHLKVHETLPLAWISTKDRTGRWTTLKGADGQPASWWLDPCALGTAGCNHASASTGTGSTP